LSNAATANVTMMKYTEMQKYCLQDNKM